MVKIAAISDLHLTTPLWDVLKGIRADILVMAGDMLNSGSQMDWIRFINQLGQIREQFSGVCYSPGNHDWYTQEFTSLCRSNLEQLNVHLLINEGIEMEGLKIWGSPVTPTFGHWAWMKDRGDPTREVWDQIPEGLDLLVTHGPSFGILDELEWNGEHVGCEELRAKLDSMDSPPLCHASGHIHSSYGSKVWENQKGKTIRSFNVSICNEQYSPTNPVTIIGLG